MDTTLELEPHARLPHAFDLAPVYRLPAQPAPILGREREAADLRELLSQTDVRLVTLTGSGGAGKTRLAVEVGQQLAERFFHGAALIELAPLADSALVASAVAKVLGVPELEEQALAAGVIAFLQDRELLLLLDNFEQVIDGAPFVADLLAACPGVKVLATSRAPLRLRWEREVPVEPLAVPDLRALPGAGELRRCPSVDLFVQRAQAVSPEFALTAANAGAVAEICVRLDGLPLAIELAAVWVRYLTPAALLERLEDLGGVNALSVLAGGPRDVPPRQRTMRATTAWSYDLLPEQERTLFRHLAVFSGSFSLRAACAVAADPAEDDGQPFALSEAQALASLGSLAEKSLVRPVPGGGSDGEPRFTMLQMVRQYGMEELARSGEVRAARRRFARYFLQLAEEAAPHLRTARRKCWLNCLEVEHDNIRAALEWSKQDEAIAPLGARLAAAVWMFWYFRGLVAEGRTWLETLLALPAAKATGSVRAALLCGAATMAQLQSDPPRAQALLEESIALWRAAGDRLGLADALRTVGSGNHLASEVGLLWEPLEEAIDLYRQLGETWGLGLALNTLARKLGYYGRGEEAQRYLSESTRLFREAGDTWGLGMTYTAQGCVLVRLGDYAAARRPFEAALQLWREANDPWVCADTLNVLGEVARFEGDLAAAMSYYEDSLARYRELGGGHSVATVLHNMGYAVLNQGEADRARAYFQEALTAQLRCPPHYHSERSLADCLCGIGAAAAHLGEAARSATLFGAADRLRQQSRVVTDLVDRRDAERSYALAQRQLGHAAFARAAEQGRRMSFEDAVAFALRTTSSPELPAADRPARASVAPSYGHDRSTVARARTSPLSAREREVAALVAQGLTNKGIADTLFISEHTAANHVDHIRRKLGVRSRAQIAAWAATWQV